MFQFSQSAGETACPTKNTAHDMRLSVAIPTCRLSAGSRLVTATIQRIVLLHIQSGWSKPSKEIIVSRR
jgi:hypothetical protein